MDRLLWLTPLLLLLCAGAAGWIFNQRVATRHLGYLAGAATALALVALLVARWNTPDLQEIGGRAWLTAYSTQTTPVADARLAFRLDGLSLIFACTTLSGGALALLALAQSLGGTLRGYGRLWTALLLLIGGVVLGVLAADLLLLTFGWGLAWLGTALTRRLVGNSDERLPPALLSGIASGLLLVAGISGLVVRAGDPMSGAYGLGDVGTSLGLATWLALALAAMLALALPPFSRESIDDAGTPPLVHGTLLALGPPVLGAYLLLRMLQLSLGRWPAWSFTLLTAAGAAGLLLGAAQALRSRRFGPLIGAQSVAQWGLMALLLGRYDPGRPFEDPTNSVLLLAVVGLALVTQWSTLLSTLALGALERHSGSDLLEEQPLLAAPLRGAGVAYAFAALLATGLPPLGGFWLRRWLLESGAAGSALVFLPVASVLLGLSFLGPATLFWRVRPDSPPSRPAAGSLLPIVALLPVLAWLAWPPLANRLLSWVVASIVPAARWDVGLLDGSGGLRGAMALLGLLLLLGALRTRAAQLPAWNGGEMPDRSGGSPHTPQAFGHHWRWLAALSDPRTLLSRAASSLEWLSSRFSWVLGVVSGRYYLTGILIAALTLILLLVQ